MDSDDDSFDGDSDDGNGAPQPPPKQPHLTGTSRTRRRVRVKVRWLVIMGRRTGGCLFVLWYYSSIQRVHWTDMGGVAGWRWRWWGAPSFLCAWMGVDVVAVCMYDHDTNNSNRSINNDKTNNNSNNNNTNAHLHSIARQARRTSFCPWLTTATLSSQMASSRRWNPACRDTPCTW